MKNILNKRLCKLSAIQMMIRWSQDGGEIQNIVNAKFVKKSTMSSYVSYYGSTF